MKVREIAVGWIRQLSCDELVDYLPQLLQALKHETYEASPLARFLLERALMSPKVAHHVYWLLNQALPGQSPQVREINLFLISKLLHISVMLRKNQLSGFLNISRN